MKDAYEYINRKQSHIPQFSILLQNYLKTNQTFTFSRINVSQDLFIDQVASRIQNPFVCLSMLPCVLTLIRTVVLGSRANTNQVGSYLQFFYHNYIYTVSIQVEMNLEKHYSPSRDIRDTLHFNGTWSQYKRNNFIKRLHPNVIIQLAITILPTIPFFRNWPQKKIIERNKCL